MNKTQLGTAIRIAAVSHEFQTDQGGNAYILHPIRIALRLRTDDEELMAMAILHDVLEDDPKITVEYLREEGISERIIAGLGILTHHKDEPYEEYIKRCATNRDTIIIKMGDLRDNSDITRLKGLRDKDFERLKKYNRAYVYLKNAKKNNDDIYGQKSKSE